MRGEGRGGGGMIEGRDIVAKMMIGEIGGMKDPGDTMLMVTETMIGRRGNGKGVGVQIRTSEGDTGDMIAMSDQGVGRGGLIEGEAGAETADEIGLGRGRDRIGIDDGIRGPQGP